MSSLEHSLGSCLCFLSFSSLYVAYFCLPERLARPDTRNQGIFCCHPCHSCFSVSIMGHTFLFLPMFVSWQCGCSRFPQTGELEWDACISHSSGGWESKIQVPAEPVSGEDPLVRHLLCSGGRERTERKLALWVSSCENTDAVHQERRHL